MNQDAKEISCKLLSILEDSIMQKNMERSSKKIYEDKFNIKGNIKLLEEIYLKL